MSTKITPPVIPVIPPTVNPGDLITADYTNTVQQALADLWTDIQAIAVGSLPPLTSANLWIGNTSNVATPRTITGDMSLSSTGVAAVLKVNGGAVAVNMRVVATNANGQLVAAPLPQAAVWIGSVGSVPTPQNLSGDVTLAESGLATVVKLSGGTVPASAVLVGTNASKQLVAATLAPAQLWIGSAGSVPTPLAVSGDATLTAAGVLKVNVATASVPGVVKIGANITVAADGTISVAAGGTGVTLPANALVIGSDGSGNAVVASLASAKLWVGSAGNLPVAQTVSGDAGITAAGVVTVTRINSGAVPVSASSLATNALGQLIVGTGGGTGSQTPWTQNIDAAGFNLSNTGRTGIGVVTPNLAQLEILSSTLPALKTGSLELHSLSALNSYVADNVFWNGSGWSYRATGAAVSVRLNQGQFDVFNAPSGTAGSAFSYAFSSLSIANNGNVTVEKTLTTKTQLWVSGPAASNRIFYLSTGSSARWAIMADASAESGSNNGSNLIFYRANDAGSLVDTPFTIVRSTGAVSINNALSVSGTAAFTASVGIGATSPASALHIYGNVPANASTTSPGGSLLLDDSNATAGSGGQIIFSAGNAWRFAAIKGYATNGSGNTQGDIVFYVRRNFTDTTLTETLRILSTGTVTATNLSAGNLTASAVVTGVTVNASGNIEANRFSCQSNPGYNGVLQDAYSANRTVKGGIII